MNPNLFSLLLRIQSVPGGDRERRRRLTRELEAMDAAGERGALVREILGHLHLERLLPAQYARFTPVVKEGMVFLLSRIPATRLARKILDQTALPRDAGPGRRLCELVADMPSLQKLGQIICRTPGLDPAFRAALTDLEDNLHTVGFDDLAPAIAGAVEQTAAACALVPEARILAEASVCAVVPAAVTGRQSGVREAAVLKLVKPRVRDNLDAELALLDALAAFLQARRESWGLGDFQFRGTFRQVRWLLEKEVDLTHEQQNLAEAAAHHAAAPSVVIPRLISCSTPAMTVMSREEGRKITDVAHLSRPQRRILAKALARVCILDPIQALGEVSLFHGDPHAGNIAYRWADALPRIILYDWAMMGRLTRRERFGFSLLALGLTAGLREIAFYAADLITGRQLSRSPERRQDAFHAIERVMARGDGGAAAALNRIEALFEELSYQGVLFSGDLFMYEKSQVTLKGVLHAIDPGFNWTEYLLWAAAGRFTADLVHMRFAQMMWEEIWSLNHRTAALLAEFQTALHLIIGRAWRWAPEGVCG